jgi:hypothetical protein
MWMQGTDPAMFAPGSITGYATGDQAYGSFAQNPAFGTNTVSAMNNMGGSTGLWGGLGDMFKGMGGMQGLMGLGQLAMGFMNYGLQKDYLGMMNEQLDMEREQWQTTKDEMNRIRGVRDRLNQEYGGGAAPSAPTAQTSSTPQTLGAMTAPINY